MGPHHPSTHGVFRMDVALDGERVHPSQAGLRLSAPQPRKNRRGLSYLASMPYTDRLDYFCSLTNNWAYALAVEKLVGQEVPERAEYIRVILPNSPACRITLRRSAFYSGDGRQRHAADVRLQRARKDSRPVRVAYRLAHDVQLHALWRMPRGCFRCMARCSAQSGCRAAGVCRRI